MAQPLGLFNREGGTEYFFFHRSIPEHLAAFHFMIKKITAKRKACSANQQTLRTELFPLLLVLRTSKRLSNIRCIRWPSQDFGFAKHSPKSKLLLKTGDKFTVFLNSQMTCGCDYLGFHLHSSRYLQWNQFIDDSLGKSYNTYDRSPNLPKQNLVLQQSINPPPPTTGTS